MNSPDLLNALLPVVTRLQELGVRYFLGGSVASSMYGIGRSTLDVDLVAELSPSHVDPLVDALEGDYYISRNMIREAIRNESCFNVIHLATIFKVDVFIAKGRDFDRSAIARIRKDTLDHGDKQVEVFVASAEDVVLNKLELFRKGDEVAKHQWDDAVGVMKVQRHALDLDYLRKWAAELSVSDLLERALAEAGM